MKKAPYDPDKAVIMFGGKCVTMRMAKILGESNRRDLAYQKRYNARTR